MLAIYGRQWEASYGHVDGDAYPEWRDALARLETNQIQRGLLAVENEGNEHPPNLIKFLRLCRTVEPYSNHNKAPALPRPKPRYSVMRIEMAKQRALTGKAFKVADIPDRMVMDWNSDDEAELLGLVTQWDDSTGLDGLNYLINGFEFSHGSQRDNTAL